MLDCIVNPSSRSGNGRRLWEDLESRLKERGIPYRACLTDGPGAALRAVRELFASRSASEAISLVVLGGDGTLNEVVSGIRDFSRVLLGYIPTGSSNDFARGLSLPKDPRALFDHILEGKERRRIDVGRLTYLQQTKTLSRLHDETVEPTRHFVVSAGIGFDAAVCEEALASGTKNFLNRIGLGKLTYGMIAVREILRADKIGVTVKPADGEALSLPHFLFAALMLLPYEGGGFRFAPDAEPDDGFFNLCMAGDLTKPQIFRSLPAAYFGKHYGLPRIFHYKTARIRIQTELPMWVHTDGEVMMKSNDIELACLPRALGLMI